MPDAEGESGQIPAAPGRGAVLRRAALRVLLWLGLLLALAASALGGAILATELRPAGQVVAARSRAAPTPTVPVPTATPIPTPAAPTRALLGPDGDHATPDGAWLASGTVTLRITLTGGRADSFLLAEAEVLPADVPFTGTQNAVSATRQVAAGTLAQVSIAMTGLADGRRYHWRVRAHLPGGMASPWSGGGVFGVSLSKPPPPHLAATNVAVGGWSTIAQPLFRWTDAGSRAPIAFFEYALTRAAQPEAATVTWRRAHGAVLALPRWAEGDWRLLVRAVDLAGHRSRPAVWPFGLARQAPPAPRIVAARPAQGAWSNIDTATVRWSGLRGAAPLRGFEYRVWSAAGRTIPGTWTPSTAAALILPGMPDGDWTVQIRAVDQAGNISAPAQWSFHLDRVHPLLTDPAVSTTRFTPPVEHLHVRSGLGKEATLTFSVYAAGRRTPVFTHSLGLREPGPIRDLMWDGRITPKHLAPAGTYTVEIDAVDRAGNRTAVRTAPITLLDKWILISIRKEALWAYQGDKLMLSTPVTNGGPDTPTLPGIFHVQGKYRGWIFRSPWPRGSPLWYPDSPTSFALLYNPDGGYFLHDAPWRYNFGPGSNSVAGTPGGAYTGTHGCTNVPYDAMARLFDWADDGTPVDIVRE
jgi:hypothetical protein